MLTVRKLASAKDIRDCVDIYVSIADDFLPFDRDHCVRSMDALVRARKFIRMAEDEEGAAAWIYADEVRHRHHPKPVFQQMYYAGHRRGRASYECVKALHEAMVEEARRLGYWMVMSVGSHMAPENKYVRMLESLGWTARHSTALMRLDGP